MFAYTEKTNCLSLREGKEPPWLRPVHGRITKASEDCTWLYCVDCHKFLFDGDASHQRWRRARDGKPPSHIPFRDAASVTKRKPSFKAQRTQARIDELLARERPIDCHAPDGQEANPLLLGTESGVPSVPEVDAISEEAVLSTMYIYIYKYVAVCSSSCDSNTISLAYQCRFCETSNLGMLFRCMPRT